MISLLSNTGLEKYCILNVNVVLWFLVGRFFSTVYFSYGQGPLGRSRTGSNQILWFNGVRLEAL